MRIGLDFDNTIVCYDQAIAMLSEELIGLPPELQRTKLALRDFLRRNGRESEWTAFQGDLYGPGMLHAQPFQGSIATMQQLEADGHELVIISHRSRYPYAGKRHDLHDAAHNWIEKHLQSKGLFRTIEGKNTVSFLETKNEKIDMIKELRCEAFVDDLPEVLDALNFPDETMKILFRPSQDGITTRSNGRNTISDWKQLLELSLQR